MLRSLEDLRHAAPTARSLFAFLVQQRDKAGKSPALDWVCCWRWLVGLGAATVFDIVLAIFRFVSLSLILAALAAIVLLE